jgi:hypothetical protein
VAKTDLLPVRLVRAARSLEERFQLLHVPNRKISQSEWNSLPAPIRKLVPDWISVLLSDHSLADGVLEYRDRTEPYVRQFRFATPSEYALELGEKGTFSALPRFGLVPFAYESDGNVWVLKFKDGPNGKLYLLDASAWDGREPKHGNGLVFASSSLALLLASMGVSEVSYYNDPKGVRSVLWYEDK